MSELDKIIGEIVDDNPNREIYITADHGMEDKKTAIDPSQILKKCGISATSIPIIKDRYEAHHSNLGGAAYVFLENQQNLETAIQTLKNTKGIEEVYSASDAAKVFSLHPDRIGDIFVLADKETVFGTLDVPFEKVSLRSHGSRHESCVPIIGYNSPFSVSDFNYNLDIGKLIVESLHE